MLWTHSIFFPIYVLSLFSNQGFVDAPWKHQAFVYADIWKFYLENSQVSE